MTKIKIFKILLAATLLIGATLALPFLSRADDASSTDFLVKDASIGSFGGFTSSTDFRQMNGNTAVMTDDASSTNFLVHTEPVNFSDFMPQSQNWRWYGDANDETPAAPLAGEDVAPSQIANQAVIKLRLTVKETSGVGADGIKYVLQFSPVSDFSSQVGTVAETGSCTASSKWCYATSTGGTDNAVISAALLSDADPCSAGVGTGCGTHNTSGDSVSTSTQSADAATEYEFTITASGASVSTVYFFRAVDTGSGKAVPVAATSSPSLMMEGSELSFSINGLPQGTLSNGTTTTVSTTPTSVPFGTLSFSTAQTAAQRISVTTNASSGYELYVMQTQPLMNWQGDTIPGVAASNLSPSPWSSACTAALSGCYGYHSSASVLSGGSTRFAPDDSFASFETSTQEVGYSPAPANSSTVDMVYKIQASDTQVNGAYENDISYIIAPSY
jgi:hypothetical protein